MLELAVKASPAHAAIYKCGPKIIQETEHDLPYCVIAYDLLPSL